MKHLNTVRFSLILLVLQLLSSTYEQVGGLGEEQHLWRSVGRWLRHTSERVKESDHESSSGEPGNNLDSPIRIRSMSDESESESSESKDGKLDIGSKCLLNRSPHFSDWPTVRFFSNRLDAEIWDYGCSGGMKFDLNISDWLEDEYADGESEPTDELGVQLKLVDSNLYSPKENTYFLVHGFLAGWSSDPWMCKMKDMILNQSNANVFIVDWSGGAKPQLPMDYSAAVANVNPVSRLLATFSYQLMRHTKQADASLFQYIGHSLGAHISGFVGYHLHGSMGRLIGFDPAGPCFSSSIIGQTSKSLYEIRQTGELDGDRNRLSKASAKTVIALHTDTTMFGLAENTAHVDVFVNGGQHQPGCPSNTLLGRFGSLVQLDLKDTLNLKITCSHSYSHILADTWAPKPEDQTSNDKTCYPMAYQCRSWNAFKAGECGTCKNLDSRCVYTGLSSQQQSVSISPSDEDADEEDVPDSQGDGDETGQSPKNETEVKFDGKGQHFMKASDKQPSCLYHYQIVIATDKPLSSSSKFQVKIPLESGQDDQVRDVRVSHMIPTNSQRHKRISEGLSILYTKLSVDSLDGITFYTALITFKSLPNCNGKPIKKDTDYWYLCGPLERLQDTDVTLAEADELKSVKWIAVNYMSGLSLENRIRFSYLKELQ